MKRQLIRYTKALLLFALLAFGILLISRIYLARYISPMLPLLILFFALVSFYVYYILLKSTRQRFAAFSRNFMLATTIKLFLYLIILVAYALLVPKDAVNFIVGFFALYIAFSAFELFWLLRIRAEE
jgi:hypothetical protein